MNLFLIEFLQQPDKLIISEFDPTTMTANFSFFSIMMHDEVHFWYNCHL